MQKSCLQAATGICVCFTVKSDALLNSGKTSQTLAQHWARDRPMCIDGLLPWIDPVKGEHDDGSLDTFTLLWAQSTVSHFCFISWTMCNIQFAIYMIYKALFLLIIDADPLHMFWNEAEIAGHYDEMKWIGHKPTFVHIQATLGQDNFLRMVRWVRWHCPPDTGRHLWWFQIENNPLFSWFIYNYVSALRVNP